MIIDCVSISELLVRMAIIVRENKTCDTAKRFSRSQDTTCQDDQPNVGGAGHRFE